MSYGRHPIADATKDPQRMTPIGDRYRTWRTQAGITRERLATIADTSVATIYRLEADNDAPKVELLERLCTAVGHTLADLFADAEVS